MIEGASYLVQQSSISWDEAAHVEIAAHQWNEGGCQNVIDMTILIHEGGELVERVQFFSIYTCEMYYRVEKYNTKDAETLSCSIETGK